MSHDNRACTVSGCDRPLYQSARFCAPHRARWYRYGDPLGMPPPRRRHDLTGQRFGQLVAVSYREDAHKWQCRCDCGLDHAVATSSLLAGHTRSCGQRLRHTTAHTYAQAHAHLRALRGPASGHPCARCVTTPAAHWAYRHAAASRRIDSGPGPWSPDPDDYEPLCVPCHKRGDLAQLATERAAAHGLHPLW